MKWLAAIGVVFPLLVAVAIHMIPAQAPVKAEERFDDAWGDTMRVIALRKADTISTAPRLVVTERVAPDAPASVPPVAEPPEDAPPMVVKRRRHVNRGDICAKHKMRKVQTGRTWRCRK